MIPELRELLRQRILGLLDAASSLGLREGSIHLQITAAGFETKPNEVAAEIVYLADKGFVTATDKPISPELKRWRITAAGRDYLATEGL